jgi:hypothetical protein
MKNILGKKFGRLLAIDTAGKDKHGKNLILCKCDCGKEVVMVKTLINTGKRLSCGCLFRENAATHCRKSFTSHGESNTRFFSIWHGMKRRCETTYKPKNILVCKEWQDYINFRNDMFESYHKHVDKHGEKDTTLDRIDNSGNYCKDNCRWATVYEQNHNKSNLIITEYRGEYHSVREWSQILGVRYTMLLGRIKKGWDMEKALKIPAWQREDNKSGKLNKEKVLNIRELYDTGEHTYKSLAVEFKVSIHTIKSVLTKHSWKWV